MIDVELHFRANGSKRHKMPCLPRVGDYVTHAGNVWRVDAVVFSTHGTALGKGLANVYVVQVSDDRREELERNWAAWTLKETTHP